MKKLLLKSVLLLCALIVGSGTIWADVVSGTTYNTPSTESLPDGWDGSDGNGSSYIKLIESSYYIQTSNFAQNGFTSIKLKARKFGGPSAAQALITVSWYYNSNETVLGTIAPTSTDLTDYTISSPTNPTANTTGYIKIQCKGAGSSKGSGVSQVTINYTAPAASVETPTFSPAAGTYTSAQDVTISCTTAGATIRYTLDGSEPTSSSTEFTTTPIHLTSTTTIKAKAFKGSDASNLASATYTILPVTHAGTALDPYTVTDARNALTAGTINSETDYYVTGYVAQKGSISSGKLTYYLSDDGGMTSTIKCYNGKYIDGANFTDSNAPAVGDMATVKGKLTIHNSSTYQFNEGNQVVSITPKPTIEISKTTLKDFTYVVGNGPSDAQTLSVSGSNLTANITLSLGATSNYEMSTTENSGYTNTLTLIQSAGTLAATTVYVRLKASLAINATYNGTITLTSTDALDKTVSLTGSVTQPVYTWDLSTNKTVAATTSAMNWIGTPAVMGVAKGTATTATDNYYPGTSGKSYTSTRFYSNSILTITPISGYTITSVVFTATSDGYANALQGSTWTNATAAVSSSTVTITPTTGTSAISATIGGTCGFTTVKVYYTGTTGATETISLNAACTDGTKYYGTYSSSNAFVVPTDMTASEISVISGELVVEDYNAGDIVPANTGVMVSSATSGNHDVYLASGGTSVLGSDNMLKPSGDAGISAANMTAADTKFYRLTMHNGTKIGFWWGAASGAAFDLAAHKAYLAIPNTAMSARNGLWFGDDATAIENVKTQKVDGLYYNLAGQRIAQPTKGLYIVNGNKVVIK